MGKTIEDRAENIYKGNTIEQDAYINGATDQRKIDIEKACDWLYKNLTINCEYGECETIEEFRKYMEE